MALWRKAGLRAQQPPPPAAPQGARVERLTGAPAQVLASLAGRGVRHVYVDGGFTVREFLRAGLIDRIIITRVPVVIGSGISIFGPLARDIRLRHIATRHYPSGLVQSEYAVLRPNERTELREAGETG